MIVAQANGARRAVTRAVSEKFAARAGAPFPNRLHTDYTDESAEPRMGTGVKSMTAAGIIRNIRNFNPHFAPPLPVEVAAIHGA
ncbi:MAG: hypothetical protein A3E78_10145 [Alphaproteobacteria bacterium RIFCSPHIGHO2_12_FULL_63_12]|nr:MAG: hypothetical protein A3E78_10145 [Alphaproteobacteria bacterium RIFCSPHIGHO2_12_FULL_63_12]